MMRSGVERSDRVVLDTSAYSRLRTGHADVLDLISRASAVLMPTIVLGELQSGFGIGSRRAVNQRELADFLDEPYVSVLDVTSRVAGRYGETVAQLRQAGTPMSTNDVWIAALTLDCGGLLATFDRDFERVQGLPVVLLT